MVIIKPVSSFVLRDRIIHPFFAQNGEYTTLFNSSLLINSLETLVSIRYHYIHLFYTFICLFYVNITLYRTRFVQY